MGEWELRAVCPCGWHTESPTGTVFSARVNCCPSCGKIKKCPTFGTALNICDTRGDVWSIKAMMWESHAIWWKPNTWGKGEWIKKGG